MKLVYDAAARHRFGISLDGGALVQNLNREQVESHLRRSGFTLKEVRVAIKAAKVEALATSAVRAQALQRFIDEQCHVVDGSLIPFGEFYSRFIDWLPRDERFAWTRYRVSHALPPHHPSGAFTANQKCVANLSWEPGTPTTPYIVIPGNKLHGRARVLAYGQRT